MTIKELTRIIVDLSDDISQANIAYWKKDDLRNVLKGLKKRVDDVERAIKAAVVNDVAEAAKKLIAEHLNTPFIVHEFNAFSNSKVRIFMSLLSLFFLAKLTCKSYCP